MMNTSERINHIIDAFCDGNANEFCRKTGITKSVTSRLRSGELGQNGIGAYAERIALAFPAVNCRWLLTGMGKPGAKEDSPGTISKKLDAILKILSER